MSIKKMSKEELELLSNKDITNLILQERKRPINTADLFNKIIDLLELPKSTFEDKIADYYTALSTDKRFILLDNGKWDLRSRYKSDEVVKVSDDEEEEDEEEENNSEVEEPEESEEDNYDDKDEEYDDDTNEELKDLVIIDEDELEE